MHVEGDWIKVFLGHQFGVGLSRRGKLGEDDHVMWTILHEDDENWFTSESGASSSWLEDCIQIIQEAKTWIETNCEPDLHKGRQYGWKFKKGF